MNDQTLASSAPSLPAAPAIAVAVESSPSTRQRITCGAKTRQGKTCARSPSKGQRRCKLHGGASHPGGPSHHLFKDGRYSKFLPAGIAERYEASLRDPDLLSARSDIALLDARLKILCEQFLTGECFEVWQSLSEAWGELQSANRRLRENAGDGGDPNAAAKAREQSAAALNRIGEAIRSGSKEQEVWGEVVQAIKDRAAVSSIEHRRMVDLQQLLTIEQAMVLFNALVATNQAVIGRLAEQYSFDARKPLAEIGNGFARLFNMPARDGQSGGGSAGGGATVLDGLPAVVEEQWGG